MRCCVEKSETFILTLISQLKMFTYIYIYIFDKRFKHFKCLRLKINIFVPCDMCVVIAEINPSSEARV